MTDKERLEAIKKARFEELMHVDVKWLIEQAEKVEKLEKDIFFWKDLAESCECNE